MFACGVYQIDFENPFMPFKEKYPETLSLWRDWHFVAMLLVCCYRALVIYTSLFFRYNDNTKNTKCKQIQLFVSVYDT